jgi:hypothetical protein
MTGTSPSPLRTLLNILSTQVDSIEANYAKAGVSYPSLDQPFVPTPMDHDPPTVMATQVAVAAATQLLATLRSPLDSLWSMAIATVTTAVLGAAEDANIVDLIFEAGPKVSVISSIKTLPTSQVVSFTRAFMLTRSLKALESTRTTSVCCFSNSASPVHTDLIS